MPTFDSMGMSVSTYTMPSAMEPLFPSDERGRLEHLATELIRKSARLSGTMNPITRAALADFLRPMNSYYSNLIEGHDTHPIDIAKALKDDFSNDKSRRNLQLEAHAHINLHKEIGDELHAMDSGFNPASSKFIKEIHRRFYEHLPEEFKTVTSKEGEAKTVVPGAWREAEVEVGRHIAPNFTALDQFMDRFETFYDPTTNQNKSKIRRVISVAASHHRLAWIHPFLDGNGRVVRLFSDSCFICEELDSSGLWSISRGLARNNAGYKSGLANADQKRINDYDGRGNLSNEALVEFCDFFLSTAIDQIDFMYDILDVGNMLTRIESFTDWMSIKGKMRSEARFILTDLFLKGKISKTDAMRITGTSDKTLKIITDQLSEMGFLESVKEGIHMMYHVRFPILYSPMLFPGIYPGDKESEMMSAI